VASQTYACPFYEVTTMNGENQGNDLARILTDFVRQRTQTQLIRDVSFDFCYAYFRSRSADPSRIAGDLERSCLHLGFFLASFGMMRGSADLLQRSAWVHAPFIQRIGEFRDLWNIDVPRYDEGNVGQLIGARDTIRRLYEGTGINNPTDTLITKIMHGVFGCVPAFDQYAPQGFARMLRAGSRTVGFCRRTLCPLRAYYYDNRTAIDSVEIPVLTLNAQGVEVSDLPYPVARKLDIIGHRLGEEAAVQQAGEPSVAALE
jgi:hypothetical protein